MNRPWWKAPCWLAVCLAAATAGNARHAVAEPAGGASLPVQGVVVDPEAPATYRLPLIGLCDPADEHVALRTDIRSTSTATGEFSASAGEAGTASAAATMAFPATSAGLTMQLLPAVQRGYNLAQRGAFYAARTEFIQVLRRVAQAKDAAAGTDEHSRELAAGLRAMDEANDFVPQGTQLEGELDVRSTASSHRTPVVRDCDHEVQAHEAVALYHRFAQEKLSLAAVDEQAGSMALYGLAKVYSRLAERSDDDVQCVRSAMTLYCAALDACPDNNLAANELGVLLCRTGHPAEAADNFVRALNIAPSATTYHNLAVAQEKLGQLAQSAANQQESQRLAAWERSTGAISRRAGIQWVSPEELASVSQPSPPTTTATTAPATAVRPQTPTQLRWR